MYNFYMTKVDLIIKARYLRHQETKKQKPRKDSGKNYEIESWE